MRRILAGVVIVVLALPGAVRADEVAMELLVGWLGGSVVRDDKQEGSPVVVVNLEGSRVTDKHVAHLNEFKHLRTLKLGSTQVTGAGLKELKDLKQLRYLNLYRTQLTDENMQELKELTQLTRLS